MIFANQKERIPFRFHDFHKSFLLCGIRFSNVSTVANQSSDKPWKQYIFPYIQDKYNKLGTDLYGWMVKGYRDWDEVYSQADTIPIVAIARENSSHTGGEIYRCSTLREYSSQRALVTTQSYIDRTTYDEFTPYGAVCGNLGYGWYWDGNHAANCDIQPVFSPNISKFQVNIGQGNPKVLIRQWAIFGTHVKQGLTIINPRILLREDDGSNFIYHNGISEYLTSGTLVKTPTISKSTNIGTDGVYNYSLVYTEWTYDGHSYLFTFPEYSWLQNYDTRVCLCDVNTAIEVYKGA